MFKDFLDLGGWPLSSCKTSVKAFYGISLPSPVLFQNLNLFKNWGPPKLMKYS